MQQAIFTIGHSTHSLERFISLLHEYGIEALADVRSTPYSRVNPQFNREELKDACRVEDIAYVFLGKELGGRSKDPKCYEAGRVRYDRLAGSRLFKYGLQRVQEGTRKFRLALMCAEREPLECHRTILVARHLTELGLGVQHIHGNGKIESHSDTMDRLVQMLNLSQHHMFYSTEELLAEAYRRQEERIAYDTTHPDTVIGSAAG